MDVALAEGYIPSIHSRILEVGAGSGRVVDYLLNHSYQSVAALERSRNVTTLQSRYADAVSDGRLRIHASDLDQFRSYEPYDVVLWLFCSITDFSSQEQCEMLHILSCNLNPGGEIIVDLPQGCTNGMDIHGQEHLIEEEGMPTYHGFVATIDEMNEYRHELSFRRLSGRPYTTFTGPERALFIFSGLVHAAEKALALV